MPPSRQPDQHTPPSIHFTGDALDPLDQPHEQHDTDLQITQGKTVSLNWEIGGEFISAKIDSVPSGVFGPKKLTAPSGATGGIKIDADVTFRLQVSIEGSGIITREVTIHAHDPEDAAMSAITDVHAEPSDEAKDVADDALLNCDLCILAYQLYHQSVIFPLDPWYEVLARGGTSRREYFMGSIHEYAATLPDRTSELYGGPAAATRMGSSNTELDPVLTNYSAIRPREPAITGDGSIYMALRAPAYIVDRIKKTSVAFYTGPWKADWPHGTTAIREIVDNGSGPDELIGFEGGTGTLDGKEAAYSLMGYVLKRTRDDGSGWDAHIAFRGSRSGSAARAAMQGLSGVGNADWVSDCASVLVDDAYYAADQTKKGLVAKGFGQALKRSMGPLRAALLALHGKYGAPKSIQVTGHSLGAALASLCSAALMQGVPGKRLSLELPGWKFSKLRGYFNALPPSGSQSYAADFLKLANGQMYAPYVEGDVVVQNTNSLSAGQQGAAGFVVNTVGGSGGYSLGTLIRMPRPSGATGIDNSHEMSLIRAGLIDKLVAAGKAPADEIKNVTPWGYFVTFTDLLAGKPVSYVRGDKPSIVTEANLRAVLKNYRFADHFRPFMAKLKDVVGNPKSYRGFHREGTYAQAAERFALAAEMASTPIDSAKPEDIADNVGTQAASLFGFEVKTELVRQGWKIVKAAAKEKNGGVSLETDDLVGEDFSARVALGLVLAAFEEHDNVTIDHFAKVPELKLVLEAVLGASDAQKKAAQDGGRA